MTNELGNVYTDLLISRVASCKENVQFFRQFFFSFFFASFFHRWSLKEKKTISRNSSYILDSSPCISTDIANIFSHSIKCYLSANTRLSCNIVHLSNLFLDSEDICVLLNLCPKIMKMFTMLYYKFFCPSHWKICNPSGIYFSTLNNVGQSSLYLHVN